MTDFTIEDQIKKEMFEQFQLINYVGGVAKEKLFKDQSAIKNEFSISDDLNGDSLDLVELAMTLEDHFGINLDDSDPDWTTVQDVIDAVTARI